MITIDRILCPTAAPPESPEALSCAVSLARAYKAKLFLCHVTAAPSLVNFLRGGAFNGDLRKNLVDSFANYLGPAASNTRWEIIVVEGEGDIGEEIVRTAREQRIDLIVMRSRRSRVASLLGSTAEQVSRTASCPVLIVHPQEREEQHSNNDSDLKSQIPNLKSRIFQRVLVSHDFSSSSELALSYALSMAEKFKSDLHLMHVLPEPEEDEPEIALNEVAVETAYQRALRRLQDSVPKEIYRRCRVTYIVRWGKPYREVLAYAREHDVDLVCMGALGSDFGSEALFGSNVDRVVRQATCSVLIARPLKPAVTEHMDLRITKPTFRKTFSHVV
jgi:nucleotide-binding universal stress UspA family protein